MLTFLDLGRYGRIGNQMSQIAGTIGIAERLGYDYGFPYWMNYDHKERFGFSEDIDIQSWFKNPLPLVDEDHHPPYQIKWGYHNVTPPPNADLKGHMQSDKYFLHCEDIIRYYFEFKDMPHDIKEDSLAIHVRCGDYGGDYHPICSERYYHDAINAAPKTENVYVFSDDPQRARLIIRHDFNYISGNHSMVDMYLMTKCRYHIIANSTFSWWGAWLAKSDMVIAPAVWFGAAARISPKDIYCDNWKVL